MPTHVALLRGINLGGRNRVAMADLRSVVSELGHADVSTYIQSGNVLFTAPLDADTSALAEAMTAAIATKLGISAPVVVLSRGELAKVIADNPYPSEPNPKCLHAVFRAVPAGRDLLDRIAEAVSLAVSKGSRDSIQSVGRTLYLHTPDGYRRSDLAQALSRIDSSPKGSTTGTARNWATVTKLMSLCGG
jgi:uncharacterized protein (DUF1697 family)